MIIVSDTSPLNGLAIVGYLPLLQQIYGRVAIAPFNGPRGRRVETLALISKNGPTLRARANYQKS